MDENRIQELLDELDENISRDGALVKFRKSHIPLGIVCTGTKQGLLRVGVEFIRAALSLKKSSKKFEDWYFEPLDYLQAHPSDYLTAIERNDDLQVVEKLPDYTKPTKSEILVTICIQILVWGFIASAILGAVTFFRWIT